MKQVSQEYQSGVLALKEVPAPALRRGGVLVATAASLLSAGTEKQMVDLAKASLAGKAFARPDLVRQVIEKAKRDGVLDTIKVVRSRLDAPVALGYSCAGRVLEVAEDVQDLRVGDRVACAGAGYASHAEVNFIPKNLVVPIPDAVDFEAAAFVTVGAIALQGVRQAAPMLGERVVVIGLGLIGLLTVQLLKANGCRVLGYDPVEGKCALARSLGADAACSSGLPEAATSFTGGAGADAVLVTASSKSDEPANAAAAISRQKGRVILVGMVGMNLEREPFYKKELDLRLSMSYGPGRYDPNYEEKGQDYPLAYVRWTERRNMSAFLDLIAEAKVTPRSLVTHSFPIEEAERAYALLEGKEPYVGIILRYPDREGEPARRVDLRPPPVAAKPGTLGVGFIGAGTFAKGVLLPELQRQARVRLTGVVTATGLSGGHTANRFGFAYAATDHREVLGDPETDLVFIATRHDTHASLAIAALQAGKHVFVEKPLAIDREQLDAVIAAAERSDRILMVGFNRRFSPLIREAKALLDGRAEPLVMLYRVNAGAIPAESWIRGEEGGGRIVGEVCHFIDTLAFLADALPTETHVVTARGHPDALSMQLGFADGSIGTIVYSSLGDRAFPKEYIEVFGADRVAVIDDFREATFVASGRRSSRKLRRQDKGFAEEIRCFLAAARGEQDRPIAPAALQAVTAATLASWPRAASGKGGEDGPA